jgi:CheY-like chemotaxis protein
MDTTLASRDDPPMRADGDAASETNSTSRVSSKARDRRPRKVCVVIVDDASGFRMATRELLERRGYHVAGEADSAAAAVKLVERLRPDAILLDVHLPDGNGFEVAARLRDHHPSVAVLLTSGDVDVSSYARAAECGAQGFVPKEQLGHVELERFWPGGAPGEASRRA